MPSSQFAPQILWHIRDKFKNCLFIPSFSTHKNLFLEDISVRKALHFKSSSIVIKATHDSPRPTQFLTKTHANLFKTINEHEHLFKYFNVFTYNLTHFLKKWWCAWKNMQPWPFILWKKNLKGDSLKTWKKGWKSFEEWIGFQCVQELSKSMLVIKKLSDRPIKRNRLWRPDWRHI